MKASLCLAGIIIAIAMLGCQQDSTTPQDVSESSGTVADPVESESTGESIEAASAANTESTDDHHEMPEGRTMGHGPGGGMGRGMGRGPGAMGGMREDMTTLHAMFADRGKIQRTVKNLPNGAEATTESDDETIAGLLQEHVPAMEGRVKENNPLPPMTFHPIFVELIKHADDYTLEYQETAKGMKVTYHAKDPFVVMLVQEHARLVSRFLKNGMEEIHKPYTLPEIPAATQKDPRAIAVAAKEALFARLSGRLMEVMKADGPAAAIEVCSREAAEIAKAIGDEHGVTIGRTAIKLRNSQNQPPGWVKPLIDKPSAKPLFVDLPDGHTGALLPIKLQAKCIVCHGTTDDMGDEVKAQLAKLYPQDRATGFQEGDLRGWFWVDVPQSLAANNSAK